MKKRNLLIILVCNIILLGCSGSVATGNWNDHIDSESRNQIKVLNDKIVEALNENNSEKLQTVFSDQLKIKTKNELSNFVNIVHSSFESKKYKLLDEYLANDSGIGTTGIALKGTSNENDYSIHYPITTNETYISLITNNNASNKILLTCMYGKYGNDWKLNVLRIGDYSFFGNTAIDFYKQAKINYEKGNIIDATNDILMMQQTFQPSDNFFQYQKLAEMKEYGQKLLAEANTKFALPKKIEEISSKPQIFSVGPKAMEEGVFPMVTYITSINLKDSLALKIENDGIKKIIVSLFPGIEKGKKYVFFQAYNDIPNGSLKQEHYGFILKTKQ